MSYSELPASKLPSKQRAFLGRAILREIRCFTKILAGRPVVRNLSGRAQYLEAQSRGDHISVYDKSSDSDGSGHEGMVNPSFSYDNGMFVGRKKDFNTST